MLIVARSWDLIPTFSSSAVDDEVVGWHRVRISVHAQDQMGLLAMVTNKITECGGDIKSAQIKTTEFGQGFNFF